MKLFPLVKKGMLRTLHKSTFLANPDHVLLHEDVFILAVHNSSWTVRPAQLLSVLRLFSLFHTEQSKMGGIAFSNVENIGITSEYYKSAIFS